MDAAWNFRHAYDEARKVKEAQDAFCRGVEERRWWRCSWWRHVYSEKINRDGEGQFPESLEWESLVDVLRGRVKVCVSVSFFFVLMLVFSSFCGWIAFDTLLRGGFFGCRFWTG
jgi:hypothetical protein